MTFFVCSNCGFGSASWYGRCPQCGVFNTLKEKPKFSIKDKGKEEVKKISLTSLKNIKSQTNTRLKTHFFEVDRVLGGGLALGEVVLLTGEPGIGKSTLVLQALANLKTLYISGEESAEQVKQRANRLNINLDQFFFSSDLQIESIISSIEEIRQEIDVLVIDSIQTVYSKDVDSQPGSINQLKQVTKLLINFAKKQHLPIILIGHMTKEGDIAGPKTLEHYVDCVLNFEGEKNSHYRLIRSFKNRFGSTDEVGIFEMTASGLKEISNPLVFLSDNPQENIGKAIVGVVEGKRPLFYEIQSLTVPTVLAVPRRVVKGLDYNKVLLILAVLRKYLNLSLDKYDIYINVVGGITIKSTSADLGLAASLISSIKNKPLPSNFLFTGEVGLLAEVRKSYFEEKIIDEGKRLGFKKIFSSQNIKNIRELKNLI